MRTLGLALVLSCLAGCVVSDDLADVRLSPPGPLHVPASPSMVYLFIESEASGAARLFLDGKEYGLSEGTGNERDVSVNELFAFRVPGLEPGAHELFARVFDGVHPRDSNVVLLVVEP